jgi:hypothetical protein
MCRGDEKYKYFAEKPKEADYQGHLVVDGRVILKWILH